MEFSIKAVELRGFDLRPGWLQRLDVWVWSGELPICRTEMVGRVALAGIVTDGDGTFV